jgi:hypothetical protein
VENPQRLTPILSQTLTPTQTLNSHTIDSITTTRPALPPPPKTAHAVRPASSDIHVSQIRLGKTASDTEPPPCRYPASAFVKDGRLSDTHHLAVCRAIVLQPIMATVLINGPRVGVNENLCPNRPFGGGGILSQSLSLLLTKTYKRAAHKKNISNVHRPTRLSRIEPADVAKMAPLSQVGCYNHNTTPHPVICQFRKNLHAISIVLSGIYEKVKI